MKTEDRKKLGAKTRKEGKEFEIRVRKDLSEKGWIVNRFDNDVKFKPVEAHKKDGSPVECYFGELAQAKTSWRRTPHGMFPLNLNPGFPDFMCFKTKRHIISFEHSTLEEIDDFNRKWEEAKMKNLNKPILHSSNAKITPDIELIAVECKITGTLDKLEKQKCKWLLDNHIFNKILIAEKKKIKNRIHIEYNEFR